MIAVCWIYGKNKPNDLLFIILFYNACLLLFFLRTGVNRLCRDVEFMINMKPGLYWRLCWAIFTPLLMFIILFYTFIIHKPLSYKGQSYPEWATSMHKITLLPTNWWWYKVLVFFTQTFFWSWEIALGWTVSLIGIAQLPLWAFYAYFKIYRDKSAKTANPFRPTADWGPKNPQLFEKYQKYVSTYEAQQRLLPQASLIVRMKRHIFGWMMVAQPF